MKSQLDYLDDIALAVGVGDEAHFGVLSSGERVYVALAANRADLLAAEGYSMAQAIARLDDGWVAELVRRWQYRNHPRRPG